MRRISSRVLGSVVELAFFALLVGCGSDTTTASETGATSATSDPGDGDGDPGDGDGDPGDGDGDPGDGDGDGDACPAMDAMSGPEACIDPVGWAWTGEHCLLIVCTCVGEDCGGLFETQDACQLAYAECLADAPCSALELGLCEMRDECAALSASPVAETNEGPCLAEPEFVGCAPQQGCDDALTWGCDPMGKGHLFPSSCMPEDFTPCEPPPVELMPC